MCGGKTEAEIEHAASSDDGGAWQSGLRHDGVHGLASGFAGGARDGGVGGRVGCSGVGNEKRRRWRSWGRKIC